MRTLTRVFVRLMSFTAIILLGVWNYDCVSMAQQTDKGQSLENSICTFEDGKQISARYNPIAVRRNEELPTGKVWSPGGSAITLFTDTDLTVGNTSIPTGAYTVYLISGKKDWTLIVSRNVTVDGVYDKKQDLVRVAMETGVLGRAEEHLRVFFGHLGPKQCEMNVDYGKTRAWMEFRQK
jgi:hypothetical protein